MSLAEKFNDLSIRQEDVKTIIDLPLLGYSGYIYNGYSSGIAHNGKVYFLKTINDVGLKTFICCLDIRTNKFEIFSLPLEISEEFRCDKPYGKSIEIHLNLQYYYYNNNLAIYISPEKPNNPFLLIIISNQDLESELLSLELRTGVFKRLKSKYFQQNFRLRIDHKYNIIYYVNVTAEFSIFYEINIETLVEREVFRFKGFVANFYLDSIKRLIIFKDEDDDYRDTKLLMKSYNLVTQELEDDLSSNFDIHHLLCPIVDGFLSKFGNHNTSQREIYFHSYDGRTQVFPCNSFVNWVTFDIKTGSIIYLASDEEPKPYNSRINKSSLVIIKKNGWIPTTLPWTPDNQNYQTLEVLAIVKTVALIRSLCYEHVISLLPNELLFEIFKFL